MSLFRVAKYATVCVVYLYLCMPAVIVTAACSHDPSRLESACDLGSFVDVTSSTNNNAFVKKNHCDSLFKKGDFAAQPKVAFKAAKSDTSYTLVMIDPDAPNHPVGNYFLHLIVSNIRGSDLAAGKLSNGHVVTSYRPPGPPQGTGKHRYMFVVFEQGSPGLVLTVPDKRAQFNLAAWAQQGNAREDQLCGPVAGVQFRAQF